MLVILSWVGFGVIILFGVMALTGAPLVPSKKREVREAFEKLYPLSKKDFIIDLGSGSGKVLKIASEYGAGGLGLELNPLLVLYSRLKLLRNKNIHICCANMFSYNFPKETTVLYVFGVERDGRRIHAAVQRQANRLHKTLYIISYATPLSDIRPTKAYKAYFLYKIKEQK